MGFPGGSVVKNLRTGTWVQSLGWEDPLEKEMATHSNIISWRIPWTEEPSGLQSTGLQSQTQLSDSTTTNWEAHHPPYAAHSSLFMECLL